MESQVKPRVALLTAGIMLSSQLLPCVFTLSAARAEDAKQRKQQVAREGKVPDWYREARQEEQAAMQSMKAVRRVLTSGRPVDAASLRGASLRGASLRAVADRSSAGRIKSSPSPGLLPANMRLAQLGPEGAQSSRPGRIKPSAPLYNPSPNVSPLPLDTSRAPHPNDIMAAGMDCGPMFPTEIADPAELDDELDKKKVKPEDKAVKLQRLQDSNLSFAKAMEEWNQKKYRQAVKSLEKHIQEFPDSPWKQEARMHVADNAQWTGRFTDSILTYEQIVEETDRTPGSRSFDVHFKALQKWAAVDILLGRFQDAENKCNDIKASDLHWRRRTWADYWLLKLQMFKKNTRQLHTCGSNALLVVLKDFGKGEQAKKLSTQISPRQEGYNLAELQGLAKKYGVEMRGFRTDVEQLAKLPMPLLIHCDFHGSAAVNCPSDDLPGGKVLTASHKALPQKATVNKATFNNAAASTPQREAPRKLQVITRASASVKPASSATRPMAMQPMATKSKHASHTGGASGSASSGSGALLSCCAPKAGHGHYFVVTRVDANRKLVHLYNPQVQVHYTVNYADLKKEYSGTGLVPLRGNTPQAILAKLSQSQQGIAQRSLTGIAKLSGNRTNGSKPASSRPARQVAPLKWLSSAEMKGITGGCYAVINQSGKGRNRNNVVCKGNCHPKGAYGEPSIEINQVDLNMYIEDTPMWHESTVGPDIEITMSYNSQEANNYVAPFGNKWSFNYGSHIVKNTAHDVIVFMPDGREDLYRAQVAVTYSEGPYPPGQQPVATYTVDGYVSPIGVHNYLQWSGAGMPNANNTDYILHLADGGKLFYDRPAGTTANASLLIEERDRWGNSLHFGYDAQARLTTVTDALGKVWTLTYDGPRIVQVKDPWERVATFSYDANGNMVEAIDMEGHAFQYTYDSNVNLTMLNTAQGPWTFEHFSNFSNNQLPGYGTKKITVLDPLQDQPQFFLFDGSNHQGKYIHRDARGNQTLSQVSQVIEGQGYITYTQYADGTSESFDYDTSVAEINSLHDRQGRHHSLTLNHRGNPTQVQVLAFYSNNSAATRTTGINYSPSGWDMTSVTNALSQTPVTYGYNTTHQVTSVTNALHPNNPVVSTYTTWGDLATVTDEGGRVTSYNYDATTKLLTSVTQSTPGGSVTLALYTYDEIGRVKTATDEANFTVSYEYNNLDQVTKVSYPDGTYEETEYVCCGMPGMVRDRSGRKTYYDYDPLKRPVRLQDALGKSVHVEYDAAGNLTRLLDSKGQITRWRYDNMNRARQKLYADGTYDQYSYESGLLKQVRNAQGKVTEYGYDPFGNLNLIDYPTASGVGATADVSAIYDALDRPTSISDGLGTHVYSYDILSRVTGIDGPFANDTLTYHYDNQNRTDWMQVQNPDGTQAQTGYFFDALERLQSLSSPAGSWSYSYVGNSERLNTLTQPNGSVTTYGYDGLQRLNSVANRKSASLNSALISGYNYGYTDAQHKDSRSYVEQQVGTGALQRINYGYDDVDQLLSEVSTETTPKLAKSYTYDPMGNRQTMQDSSQGVTPSTTVYTPNKLNQLVSSTVTAQGGTASSSSYSHDASGNLKSSPYTSYSYDDLDRLVQVVKVDPTSGAYTFKSEYVYDAFSCKVISREYSWINGAWVQQSEKRRIYDGMDVVQERDGGNALVANLTRDGNIGGILARSTAQGHFFYHYDGSGNVVQLSDSSQTQVAEYSYDAYGNMLSISGAQASANPYRYSTKEQQPTNGLYDYGYRFYSPALGRWINRDPIEEDGGLNLYEAFLNNPVNEADPYGLSTVNTPPGYVVAWETALCEAQASRVAITATTAWTSAERWNLHHVFPTEFKPRFDAILGSGVLNHLTVNVPKFANQYFHRGGARGGWWNAQWRIFFNSYDAAGKVPTRQEVVNKGYELMRYMGVQDQWGKWWNYNTGKEIVRPLRPR
jgi:RHS repeat-associated protein